MTLEEVEILNSDPVTRQLLDLRDMPDFRGTRERFRMTVEARLTQNKIRAADVPILYPETGFCEQSANFRIKPFVLVMGHAPSVIAGFDTKEDIVN